MFLKIYRHKKAQLLLEYVILVALAILAMIAVEGMTKTVRGNSFSGFDLFFRQCAAAAGGVVVP